MRSLSKLTIAILLLCSSLNAQWINGYYTANNGVQTPSQLPWSKYTEIIHFAARAGVNGSGVGNGTVNTSELTDTAALIASRPLGKKVLLSLADNGSFPMAFPQDAAAGLRSTFVTNITNTVTSNGYDGVELDWEANINTSDYTALIAALRVAMPTKTITIAVFTGPPTAVAAAAQANLDQVNVECYDLGNFTAYSWYNNPIFAPTVGFSSSCYDEMFQSGTNNGAVAAGVARAKIGVGIPFYGYRWTGCTVAQITPCTRGSFTPYRTLASDGTRFIPANQQYDSTYKAQYLSVAGFNEFDPYTGTQQIADIVTWAKSQGFGGYSSFTTEYEYLSAQTGDARYPLSTALYANIIGCPVDSNGWCVTGLSAIQNNLLGPLTPYGSSPWVYGDLANKGTVDYMVPIALAEAPALGTALSGTFSFSGGNTLTTTVNQTSPLAGEQYITCAWSSVDGAGTGRMIVPISSVTSTTVVASENFSVPSFSGVTCYKMSLVPDSHGCNFTCWTTENPNTVWNYYDVAIGLYRLYYRTGNVQYQAWARQFADIQWQWVLDHGYRTVSPRAGAYVSQLFRAGESHTERLPGLYNWLTLIVPSWATNTDLRESGYTLWDVALGAKVDPDPTRHAQYCSWLTTYVANPWIANQNADGSWSENEFQLNASYVSAPKSFTPPFQYQAAPWREAINIKSLEAAYESLNDTATQGCNSPTLAAQTLTSVTKAATWQNNYGRDSGNRGDYYEVNSQSNDQASVSPAMGTVSSTLSSTAIVGVGTNWNTAGYCDGTHFIGFFTPRTVYKIASCSDNTHATLTVAFGLYGEVSNVSGDQFGIAPAASTGCNSSATYCYTGSGDRNLTRTNCGGIGWLYAQTLNTTYLGWLNECYSATLGGPTAGLTGNANLGQITLPCSGPACDGLVTDVVASAGNCNDVSPPCLYGVSFGNLGKNYGEAFGAPGIDNALAWRLLVAPPPPVAPTITSSSPLPGGTTGTGYSFQFVASGTAPITWTGTGLPSWASLSSSGLLTGTPNAAAASTLAITATNLAGSNSKNFSLTTVSSGTPPTITSASPLPNGTLAVAYSLQFAANGTVPITWTATGLPIWASLSSSGLLTGNPTVTGTSNIAVTATNAIGTNPKNFSLTIVGIAPTITSISPLPGATNGTPYSFQFTASGTPPITWTASGLPGWASFSTGGLLTGTPNANGTTTIAITALNATGTSGPHNFNITVVAGSVAPTITTTSPLPNAVFGSPYSFQFAAAGTAPIVWSGTGLPAWATLSGTGLLTGTPNAIAVSTLHITATNGTGSDGPSTFSLTVPGVAPTITTASPLPGGTVGIPYSRQLAASGTTPITWSATGLPGWASLSASGLLSGTPNAAAVSSFQVTATNATGSDGPDTFALTIVAGATAPTITSTSPLPGGTTLTPYSYQFTANGTAPITWSATGLPGWASLSSGGLLTGLPNAAATSTIQATATNSGGSAGPTAFSLMISSAPPPPATCSPRTGITPPSATDIQYQTNMALGLTACTNSLTGSGCTVVDVQRVINAALGGACVVGP